MNSLASKLLQNRPLRVLIIGGSLFILSVLIWPINRPNYDYSTIVNDSNGSLLSATVAEDSQWRFPKPDTIPMKIITCVRYFEDEYFYWHPGINPISLVRATWQNTRSGKIVSGASTINMQIARMIGQNRRTILNKLSEIMIALKLELLFSKDDLMIQYLSMAPFGGNVVGLEAASWRYYGRPPHLLSWGESTTLAVLPNNPGSIFPGTRDSLLINKRNRLLQKLNRKGVITSQTLALALLEPLPDAPLPIPNHASHLLTTYSKKNGGKRLKSTLDPYWHSRVSDLTERHHGIMMDNGVENIAAMVVDLKTGELLAYKGNTNDFKADGQQVDILQSKRSPGSSLKPLLFAASLDRGLINRKTLLSDVPTFFGGFSPKNFNYGYAGVVPANEALSRSLNIPMVHLLNEYTYEQFHQDLKTWGITTLDRSAGHYGLTLILGGCEIMPWDLAQVYFSLYRKVTGQPNIDIHYGPDFKDRPSIDIEPDAIWQTLRTMTTLARPDGEKSWRTFSSSQLIAWKTGTSHGFRDAWALGINGDVLVLVWVGNADGEGRAEMTGIKAAAPLMHSILRLSDNDPKWLDKLKPFMRKEMLCSVSGMLANQHCPKVETEVTTNAQKSGLCNYHQSIILDEKGLYRVTSDCYPLSLASVQAAFVLPPIQGHYYAMENSNYHGLPPVHPDCEDRSRAIGIMYPTSNSKVFIPKEIDGKKGRVVLQATHQVQGAELYWHLNDLYLGQTKDDHQLAVWLPAGNHVLSVMDKEGNKLTRTFEVISDDH
jgi:penicillin-binding protein 1C